jgi:hypothetical protein
MKILNRGISAPKSPAEAEAEAEAEVEVEVETEISQVSQGKRARASTH